MNAFLLAVTLAAYLGASVIKKYLIIRLGSSTKMYVKCNLVTSIVSAFILLLFAGAVKASPFTVLTGVAFGVITLLQFFALLKAMDLGPFSYTALMLSLSTIIPTLSGYLIWKEPISKIKIIGIALMFICFVCSVDYGEKGKKASLKWLVYALLCFFSTGIIGVMQKWHQSSEYKAELDSFLVIAFLFSVVISLVILPFVKKSENADNTDLKLLNPLAVYGLMAVCGACTAFNNKINLYLSGVMESAVFYPVVNGGALILTSVAAFIFFKEKLSKSQWFGLIIGIASVILLCDPFSA